MPDSLAAPPDDRPIWKPSPPRRSKQFLPDRSMLSGLAMAGTLTLPVLLSLAGAAAVAKIAFPVLATIVAFWLSRTAPARYVVFTLLTFMTAAGLRHVVDWHAGYSKTNLIVLAPYLLVLVAAPGSLLYLFNRRPYTVVFSTMLMVIVYGLLFPFLDGNVQPALLTFVYWVCPLLFGIYIVAHAQQHEAIRDAVQETFLIALPLMAAYGIWQYVSIPPWDAYFMESAGPITAMGFPQPFQVRVFGTMNSPGALATVLATGILLTIPALRGIRWLGFILALSTLLLTTQRAVFGGLVVGIVVLVAVGRDRVLRGRLLRLAGAALLTVVIALAVPGVGTKVSASLGSVTRLDKDESAHQRLEQYRDFPEWLADRPLGRGMGWTEDPVYVRVGSDLLIDSGIIDAFVTLGMPGGLLFFATLGMLVIAAAQIALTTTGRSMPAQFAAVMFGIAGFPFGAPQTAAPGICLYLCIGLLLAGSPAMQRQVSRA